jgi:hypothetical protein
MAMRTVQATLPPVLMIDVPVKTDDHTVVPVYIASTLCWLAPSRSTGETDAVEVLCDLQSLIFLGGTTTGVLTEWRMGGS